MTSLQKRSSLQFIMVALAALLLAVGVALFAPAAKADAATSAKKSVSNATIYVNNVTYNGKAQYPAVKVLLKGNALKKGVDYTITYTNNKNAGKATVTIKGKGNYTGKKTGTFTVNGIPLSKLKVGGTWYTKAGKKYYKFNSATKAASGKASPQSDWVTIAGKKYYFNYKGYANKGFCTVNKAIYYFDKDCVMQTSWQLINGKYYYFGKNGVMFTGLRPVNGEKYYFNKKGAMQTGWQRVGGNKYYFKPTGQMMKNTWIDNCWLGSNGQMAKNAWVDGGKYYVGSDGKWVKSKKR